MHLRIRTCGPIGSRCALSLAVVASVLPASGSCKAQTGQHVPAAVLGRAVWPQIREEMSFTEGVPQPVGEIRVFEDGVEQVGATLQKDDDPVSICLILDVSSSMKLNGPAVLEASRRLIANRNPSDEVEIVSFNGPIVMIQGFTTDAGQLEAAFQRLQFRGHSNLFDAVSGSMDKLKKYVPRFRPVFVIISDGDDNFSQSTLPDLVQRVTMVRATSSGWVV